MANLDQPAGGVRHHIPPHADMAAIGARIRAARVGHGLTQDTLAAAIGVSRSAVAQWETGRAGQLTTNLQRIAAVLAVNIEYLVHGAARTSAVSTSAAVAASGDELALLRLYRSCSDENKQILLRTARALSRQPE